MEQRSEAETTNPEPMRSVVVGADQGGWPIGQITQRIAALRDEAGQVGDLEQVTLCTSALTGDTDAITECLRVLAVADASNDDEAAR